MYALPVLLSDMQHIRGSRSMMYVKQGKISYDMLKHYICHRCLWVFVSLII
jgi:hypothetical protein